MQRSTATRARHSLHYALDALHALPCGCVAAVYRTQPLDVEVVSLEARGPHCVFAHHQNEWALGMVGAPPHRLNR